MKKSENKTIQRGLLKWMMNATLVLSVLAFSGHVSQSKSSSFEPTRTEVTQTSWADCEKTIRFKSGHSSIAHYDFFNQAENFHSYLLQCERQIALKLKRNFGTRAIQDKQFLIHYFTYNSEVSDTDTLRG